MEIVPNLRPIVFWLKVRTRGPQPSICVPTFSQFTKTPGESQRPVSSWTPRELADEAVKHGIVKQISPRTVGVELRKLVRR
jgi:hypothetical protein